MFIRKKLCTRKRSNRASLHFAATRHITATKESSHTTTRPRSFLTSTPSQCDEERFLSTCTDPLYPHPRRHMSVDLTWRSGWMRLLLTLLQSSTKQEHTHTIRTDSRTQGEIRWWQGKIEVASSMSVSTFLSPLAAAASALSLSAFLRSFSSFSRSIFCAIESTRLG